MNENNFKAFDKVLVRDGKNNEWMCDFYSHYDNETEYHFCVGGRYECCIPYEGYEELLGTTDSPQPKRWRAEGNDFYYFAGSDGKVYSSVDRGSDDSNILYEIGNYFRTEEEAKKVAKKFKAMLKGE